MSSPHAMILAAGKGERLAPYTNSTNKVLLEIGGRPVIDRMLDTLEAAGLVAVTIVTGHCADLVEQHVARRGGAMTVRYVRNPQFATSNNIVSLSVGLAVVPPGSSLLLIEGDLLLDPALVRRMVEDKRPDIALVERFRPGLDGTLARVDDGLIADLIMGDRLARLTNRADHFKTVNVTRLSASTLDDVVRPALDHHLNCGRTADYYEAVLADLLATDSIVLGAVEVDGERWAEIDDPMDIDRAEFLFTRNGKRAILDRAYGGYWNYPVLDFAYPLNRHFPTGAVRQELGALLPALLGHYGSAQAILDLKLARFLGCPADDVVLLNGASQLFPWLASRYGEAEALVPTPSFAEYSRIWPSAATYTDGGQLDMTTIAAAARSADVVVFVNPNNPTGTALANEAILRFAASEPGKQVIVDESFADFSEQADLCGACAGHLPHNVLVLKSLGKALGVTGLRLGYARSTSPELTAEIRSWLPIWNSNALAEAMLELLPKHRRRIADSIARTMRDRDAMKSALERLPIIAEVWPSHGNFLLTRLDVAEDRREELLEHLLDHHGVYIKDLANRIGRPGCWVRLSVRTAADNQRLYAALQATAEHLASSSPAIHR